MDPEIHMDHDVDEKSAAPDVRLLFPSPGDVIMSPCNGSVEPCLYIVLTGTMEVVMGEHHIKEVRGTLDPLASLGEEEEVPNRGPPPGAPSVVVGAGGVDGVLSLLVLCLPAPRVPCLFSTVVVFGIRLYLLESVP